jgi:hypothetical protein
MNTLSTSITGASLALVAAGLASLSGTARAADAPAAKAELGHCMGVNACKGHNGCKTANNACKGQGGCKGQGFVEATASNCDALGGRMDAGSAKRAVAVETVKCHGANACKGHNDCKTANNACKGQGGCKGQGFVAIAKATCSDVGGKVQP